MPYTGNYLRGATSVLLSYLLLAFAAAVAFSTKTAKQNFYGINNPSNPMRMATRIVAVFVMAKFSHDLIFGLREAEFRTLALHTLNEFANLAFVILVWLAFPPSEIAVRFATIAMAVAVNCGINTLAFRAGIVTGESITGSHAALSGTLTERMLAPFAGGLNNFGCIAAAGSGLGILVFAHYLKSRQWAFSALMLVSLMVSFIALFLVQMRSALISLLFALVWILPLPVFVRRVAVIATPLMVAVVPVLFINLGAVNMVTALMPDVLESYMQRRADELLYLGGRANVWDYGFSMVSSGQVGILGVGLASCDASEVLNMVMGSTSDTRASFHNAMLNLLIAYGPLLTAVALLGIIGGAIKLGAQLTRQAQNSVKTETLMILGAATLISSLGFLESFSSPIFFWAMLLLAYLSAGNLFQAKGSVVEPIYQVAEFESLSGEPIQRPYSGARQPTFRK